MTASPKLRQNRKAGITGVLRLAGAAMLCAALAGATLIGATLTGAGAANAQKAKPNPFGTYQKGQHYIDHMPPLSLLVEQFNRVALKSETGGRDRHGRIIKWNGPIRVKLSGVTSGPIRDEVISMLHWLSALTGVQMVERAWLDSSNANLEIVFFQGPTNRVPNNENVCSAKVHHRGFVIVKATVRIMSNHQAIRRHCIVEELTQILGLLNDTDHLYPSIFNDWDRGQGLHAWDELMVRTLYDRRIRPGMRRRDALIAARHIMGELLRLEGVTTRKPLRSTRRSKFP